ncbi:TPA: bifunctional hydroxymethylpyrimidine kinase/phosphomethylpyrimidine kinase, partial [Listeria monocytogenes]|nr:bifunctional hydroxymethylpyrimidine kinase/phosphomethylpyrimidine kinase [Listeria monocytogenes]
MIFPQVLTIAGSDSGGGAGIQADIKTFQERKTFGMSVITAITAQNTLGVKAVHKIPVEMIREQCDAIAEDFQVSAVKTGMLADAEIIREVARNIRLHNFPSIVIDPVMIAKGGTALL